MGVLPIGFFSPLPLAMMIPFMATQSLAMGEAFGKSFQYGKRKISSMTNEEFNKYTFSNMMDEQTANIKLIIPKLHEQMQDSSTMQKDIFTEMIKIIPAFMESVVDAVKKALPEDYLLDNLKDNSLGILDFTGTSESSSDQTQSQIINISHGDGSTTTTGDAGDQEIVPPDQQKRINLRNRIQNWNRTTTEGFITSLEYKEMEGFLQDIILQHLEDIKKFEGENDIPIPEQKPLTSQEKAQKAYLTKTTLMIGDIIKAKASYILTYNNWKNAASAWLLKSKNLKFKQFTAKQKLLKNFITISRNNIVLKSVANKDWNDHIWIV